MRRFNNKGVTLIELLLTISLMSVVMIPLFSFFYINIKTFNEEDKKIELQQHGQFAIEYMTNIIIQCEKIIDIKTNENKEIKSIIFIDSNNKKHDFKVTNSTIKYNFSELARYIQNVKFELIPNNLKLKDYEKAYGIKLDISLIYDNSRYKVSNLIYFRNNTKDVINNEK